MSRLLVVALILLGALHLSAERLPIKTYTVLDGLAHNHINRIKVDSHGFLWFCTDAGLSRFDGRRFFTLTTDDGLPHPDINDIVEARDGSFWLAGDGGISHFALSSPGTNQKPKIRTFRPVEYPADLFDALELDRAGRLWAGGNKGLYQIEGTGDAVRVRWTGEVKAAIPRLVDDRRGGLWIATTKGAIHRDASGRQTAVVQSPLHGVPHVETMLEDRQSRIWVGFRTAGLCLIERAPKAGILQLEYCVGPPEQPALEDIRAIHESRDGRLWLGTNKALCEFDRSSRRPTCYGTENGLAETRILKLGEDPEGNLWLGTAQSGVMRLATPGFLLFPPETGMPNWGEDGLSLTESRAGQLVVSTGSAGEALSLMTLEGRRFREAWRVDKDSRPGPGSYRTARAQGPLEDAEGRWWIPEARNLHAFPPGALPAELRRVRPERFQLPPDLLHSRLYEDSRGALWASTVNRWPRVMRKSGWIRPCQMPCIEFREEPVFDGPLARAEQAMGYEAWASAFREDRDGSLWLGLSSPRRLHPPNAVSLLRYRSGRVEEFSVSGSLPAGNVNWLHQDRTGRLWLATHAGLLFSDNPSAQQPRFTRAAGLLSDEVWCVTEDDQGRIYAGTAKGVDRLDLKTGLVRHFNTNDGLPQGAVLVALRSRSGQLWFGSANALARFAPEQAIPAPPATYLVSPAAPLKLSFDQRHFEAEFTSPSFSGTPPRFQYRLSGVDADWRPPVTDGIVRYAGMGAGDYELQARAITAAGVMSATPATLRFSVTPPFWQTWWFAALALSLAGSLAYLLHIYRVRRLLAMERLRVRLASDLHDEIGSSLSQVSMLGELARRSLNGSHPAASELIDRMAATSRDAVTSMSDIVWSIHPRNDGLGDLVKRMRGFAVDVLSARGIEFEFDAPAEDRECALPLDIRRDLLLIFKEGVNNAARHAGCRHLRAKLQCTAAEVLLTLEDDGHGFDLQRVTRGQGLGTMQARAERLAGQCRVRSGPEGTVVAVTIPLKARV